MLLRYDFQFYFVNFLMPVAEKLDCTNYLHWQQYVEPTIKSHKLQSFVLNPVIPFKYLTKHDRTLDTLNP